jgi:hypothetical protein
MFTGLKRLSRALVPLCHRPSTNFNSDNAGSSTANEGRSTPTCGHNADNLSECGDDGHNNNDGDDEDGTPITGKQYTQHQFWNYVDDYLTFIHTELFQKVTDTAARRGKIIW